MVKTGHRCIKNVDGFNQVKNGKTKGVAPGPNESVQKGIQWLYRKGVLVSNVTWDIEGNVNGGDVTWVGGSDWSIATREYNGSDREVQYLSEVCLTWDNLTKGFSDDGMIRHEKEVAATKEKQKKAAAKEADRVKNQRTQGPHE